MTIYTIRAGFTITLGSTVYQGGTQIDLAPEQFELHKHKLQGVDSTVLPIIFPPRSSTSSQITYNDTAANIVDGTTAASLQSAIVSIDSRIDAIETSIKGVLNTPTTFYVDAVNGVNGTNNGQTTGTAFQSLLYALVYIRDNYIIDSNINIQLLTDIDNPPDETLSLIGFQLGTTTVFPQITVIGLNSGQPNKKIILNNIAFLK